MLTANTLIYSRAILVLSLSLVGVACTHKTEEVTYINHDMTHSAIDVELPSALWDRIDKIYKLKPEDSNGTEEKKKKPEGAEAKKEGEPEKTAEAPKVEEAKDELDLMIPDDVTKEYVPLTVRLTEKSDNHGVLKTNNHQLFFGAGGGILDLADFVDTKRGSYFLQIDFAKGKSDDEEPATSLDFSKVPLKIFFLSNSKKRKFQDKTIGSGCFKYFDISSFFTSSMKGKGFLMNTTDQLDVSSLSGSFFFVAQISKTLYISQLSVKDSRYNRLQCRPMLSKIEAM